jgi:hypothetical protein
VLPEFLQFYRQVDGSLARILPSESAKRRLLDAYEDSLQALGLKGAALALAGLFQSGQQLNAKVKQLSVRMAHPPNQYAFFSRAGNRFEIQSDVVDGGVKPAPDKPPQ